MKFFLRAFLLNIILFLIFTTTYGQGSILGEVFDEETNEPLIGATILVKGTSIGTVTDFDGSFLLKTDTPLPFNLNISYTGYQDQEIQVTSFDEKFEIKLGSEVITTEVIEVRGQRVSDKQKASPLTVESLDILAIKETPSDNFYDGLGSLKGVDLTAASLGFKIVNTRGFNSTSPVRTLQIIDGVDNQAPGLNFSLGNFLGSSELDVLKVDLIQGASSAFYGPNAFNGVISMETKDPFFHKGLAAMVKVGERNLLETAIRYADAFKNKDGHDVFGFKLNFSYLTADDWEAENYDPVDGSLVSSSNPGRFDAVNIYGDEYQPIGDFSSFSNQLNDNAGLGIFYRTGYREIDLVDYDTRNLKANVGFYFRTQPSLGPESPELILSSSYGTGSTVYQGDNRFRLEGIQFSQTRLEFKKRDKYFIRAYATFEGAGDSYDPFFTALKLQQNAKSDEDWGLDYSRGWKLFNYADMMREMGYPEVEFDFSTIPVTVIFDQEGAAQWLEDNNDVLKGFHQETEDFANSKQNDGSIDFFEPGTARFQQEFDKITSSLSNGVEDGTRFKDNSALYHIQGEYTFEPSFFDEWKVGGSARLYNPSSDGTIFSDTLLVPGDESTRVEITNFEFGLYTGFSKEFFDRKLRANVTVRVDKNENFDWISTPAASLVWKPRANHYLRVSFSSAIRNPTLTDQYLNLNVGRAILSGNLQGADSLITLESFDAFRTSLDEEELVYFDVAPVKPERVRTFELGYRATLWNSLYVDAGYYYNVYNDFLGFNIGLDVRFDEVFNIPRNIQAFRYAANSIEQVQTQGFAIGLNYYFAQYFQLSGNYSWNQLISEVDDPIVPAFNTPEHKFNIGLSGRNINNFGFNVNFKWIDGFLFEGSPQFTGFVPSYSLLDAQINYNVKKWHTTFKLGASNLLDNQQFQTYGGPRIGRLAYLTLTYDFKKR